MTLCTIGQTKGEEVEVLPEADGFFGGLVAGFNGWLYWLMNIIPYEQGSQLMSWFFEMTGGQLWNGMDTIANGIGLQDTRTMVLVFVSGWLVTKVVRCPLKRRHQLLLVHIWATSIATMAVSCAYFGAWVLDLLSPVLHRTLTFIGQSIQSQARWIWWLSVLAVVCFTGIGEGQFLWLMIIASAMALKIADATRDEVVTESFNEPSEWIYIIVMTLAAIGFYTVVCWIRAGIGWLWGKLRRTSRLEYEQQPEDDEPVVGILDDLGDTASLPSSSSSTSASSNFGGFIGVTETNTIPIARGVRVMEKKAHRHRQCEKMVQSTVVHLKVVGRCKLCWKDE